LTFVIANRKVVLSEGKSFICSKLKAFKRHFVVLCDTLSVDIASTKAAVAGWIVLSSRKLEIFKCQVEVLCAKVSILIANR